MHRELVEHPGNATEAESLVKEVHSKIKNNGYMLLTTGLHYSINGKCYLVFEYM